MSGDARTSIHRPISTIATLAFVGAVAVFSVWVKTKLRSQADASPVAQIPIGRPMASFSVMDTSGHARDLQAEVRAHRVVIVDFWASWCAPCRMEMPQLESVYRKYRAKGLAILAISEDRTPAALAQYLRTKPVSFPVLADSDQTIGNRFGIESLPTTVIICDGQVLRVTEGVQPYFEYEVAALLRPRAPKQRASGGLISVHVDGESTTVTSGPGHD